MTVCAEVEEVTDEEEDGDEEIRRRRPRLLWSLNCYDLYYPVNVEQLIVMYLPIDVRTQSSAPFHSELRNAHSGERGVGVLCHVLFLGWCVVNNKHMCDVDVYKGTWFI